MAIATGTKILPMVTETTRTMITDTGPTEVEITVLHSMHQGVPVATTKVLILQEQTM